MESNICLSENAVKTISTNITSDFFVQCRAEITKGKFPFALSIKNLNEYTYTTVRAKLESLDYHVEYDFSSNVMIVNTRRNKVRELLHM